VQNSNANPANFVAEIQTVNPTSIVLENQGEFYMPLFMYMSEETLQNLSDQQRDACIEFCLRQRWLVDKYKYLAYIFSILPPNIMNQVNREGRRAMNLFERLETHASYAHRQAKAIEDLPDHATALDIYRVELANDYPSDADKYLANVNLSKTVYVDRANNWKFPLVSNINKSQALEAISRQQFYSILQWACDSPNKHQAMIALHNFLSQYRNETEKTNIIAELADNGSFNILGCWFAAKGLDEIVYAFTIKGKNMGLLNQVVKNLPPPFRLGVPQYHMSDDILKYWNYLDNEIHTAYYIDKYGLRQIQNQSLVDCPICLTEMKIGEIVYTPSCCIRPHLCHLPCLVEHFKAQDNNDLPPTCPTCRCQVLV
jgi:hypothetical protein